MRCKGEEWVHDCRIERNKNVEIKKVSRNKIFEKKWEEKRESGTFEGGGSFA